MIQMIHLQREALIIDVTCAPQNIEFPQDINQLNQSGENLEYMIDEICFSYNIRNQGCTGK